MSEWVNFAEIRTRVSLEDVIFRFYKIDTLKRVGNKLTGPCPVHGGDSPTAFRADLDKNVWYCFTKCRKGGNQIDFVAAKENITVRDAALKLQAFFLGNGPDKTSTGPPSSGSTPPAPPSPVPASPPATPTTKPTDELPPQENPPLNMTLDLKSDHPHLIEERKLKLETTQLFGVGYCSRGIMRGTIAIPIHDDEGHLVAYAGRRLKPVDIREFGKYKFPKGFRKDLVLYNLHRARENASESGIILVEGFFSVLKLHEAGLPNTVAAMGCDLSEAQARLLADVKEVIIIFDGNEAGRNGAQAARKRLEELNVPVRLVHLPDDMEPDDLPPKGLRWLVNGMIGLDLAEVSFTLRQPKGGESPKT
ncbi:MAG: toprim domain-containing protein [bacterium]